MINFKKITALILLIVMPVMTVPSYGTEANEIQENIYSMDNDQNLQSQGFYNFFTGTVKEITNTEAGTTKVLVENEDDMTAYFIISENTYFIDDVKLETGKEITGYYEAGKPMILIYPPQYAIEIVSPVFKNENVKADKFDSDLLSGDRTLKLNISEDTEILWEKGTTINWFAKPTVSDLEAVLSNRKLIVFYKFTTKSIPAQTTPTKIIVFSQQEEEIINIIVNDTIIDAPQAYTNDSGEIMVPVRAISEALGYTVLWNNENKSVKIGDYISFSIGENCYTSSENTQVTLELSPEIVNSSTYVPLNFFKEVFNINVVSFFENNVIISKGRTIE